MLNSLFFGACNSLFRGLSVGSGELQNELRFQAFQQLSFILRCTNNRPDYSELRKDATVLLDTILIPRRDKRPSDIKDIVGYHYVPTQNYNDYHTQMERIHSVLKQLQAAYDQMESESRLTDAIRDAGKATLNAIDTTQKNKISNVGNYEKLTKSMDFVAHRRQELVVC